MLKVMQKVSLLLGVGIVALSVVGSAHAANSASVDTSVTVKPSLTLNVPLNTITMNLDPTTHAFDEKNLTVSVGTNNPTGYQLTINTVSNASSLVNTVDSAKTIPTLASSSAPADFPANYWGIRKTAGTTSSGNYTQFTAPYTVSSSIGPVNNDQTTLGFGAKVDYTKPAGSYRLDLEFKALPIVTQYYMQDIAADSTLAAAVCTEEPAVVLDKRDERTYTIARLPDGLCWMTQNLDLAGGTTITSADSNIEASSYTLPASDNGPGSFSDDNTAYVYNNGGTACAAGVPCYSYYSYKAATAGTNPSSGNASSDICPKGWRLPTLTEFTALKSTYTTGATLTAAPFNGVYSGYYYDGTFYAGGRYGRYWSSTPSLTTTNAYFLFFTSSDANTNAIGKGEGYSVRCVMRNTTTTLADISTMQEVTPDIVRNTPTNSVKQLRDTRESNANSYYVAKLKDGKLWMVQNLQLGKSGSSVTLTSADSNISASSWTLNGKLAVPGKFTGVTCTPGTCEDRATGDTTYNNNNAYYCTPVSGDSSQFVGCYYDWYSATAGSGDSNITPVGGSVGYKDVANSICPKGWYLPSGGGEPFSGSTSDRPDSDFNVLYNNYPSATQMLVSNPTTTYDNASGANLPGFLLTGYHYTGGVSVLAENSYYWSRSAFSKGIAYRMSMSSSAVYPQGAAGKYYGFSVRCLAYPN